MIFRQLFDEATWTYTYLIASGKGREAVIIDPVIEHTDMYLTLIDQLGIRLVRAMDTHVHADHITALGALREKTQCITNLGEQTDAECVSETFKDGDVIDVDGIKIKTLHTPGHTNDSYSFVMADRVFTGDTLLIRGSGRTDFQAGDPGDSWDSITGKLFALPDETLVYPGHDYKGWTVSTIGEEKQFNPRLAGKSREEYIEIMNNLNLPDPKLMDIAVPANLKCGRS
ncbi:MAG TPA: Zn-dependent hydrolase [Oceanospirillales bacterium]|nr:Zn-dependent hydrolase [Oceanospirillaceae bacterium]HBS42103.1 Zn-dependent hydrolase [Oceanospirillales bacterium]|tara:strand:- start:2749 stop:3432 length:684 start_codon:yes stop_codon:yes gene_type:complete